MEAIKMAVMLVIPTLPPNDHVTIRQLPEEAEEEILRSPDLNAFIAEDQGSELSGTLILGEMENSRVTHVVVTGSFDDISPELRPLVLARAADHLRNIFRKYFGGQQKIRIIDLSREVWGSI